jgi:hypothetical protein
MQNGVTMFAGKQDTADKLAFYDRLVSDAALTAQDKVIAWVMLSMRHFQTGNTWASHATRAQIVGCKTDSARRSAKRLVDRGWFTKSKHTGPFNMDEYRPNFDASTKGVPYPTARSTVPYSPVPPYPTVRQTLKENSSKALKEGETDFFGTGSELAPNQSETLDQTASVRLASPESGEPAGSLPRTPAPAASKPHPPKPIARQGVLPRYRRELERQPDPDRDRLDAILLRVRSQSADLPAYYGTLKAVAGTIKPKASHIPALEAFLTEPDKATARV